jgi:hypothetical protein
MLAHGQAGLAAANDKCIDLGKFHFESPYPTEDWQKLAARTCAFAGQTWNENNYQCPNGAQMMKKQSRR